MIGLLILIVVACLVFWIVAVLTHITVLAVIAFLLVLLAGWAPAGNWRGPRGPNF